MIPADILTALLVIALAVIPTWLLVRATRRAHLRQLARRGEPDDCGDGDGHPVTGRAGDMPRDWSL